MKIITNKREESDWETHIKTNKVGLDFARWILKIWTTRCHKLELDQWYNSAIEDVIEQSKPYWIEECIERDL